MFSLLLGREAVQFCFHVHLGVSLFEKLIYRPTGGPANLSVRDTHKCAFWEKDTAGAAPDVHFLISPGETTFQVLPENALGRFEFLPLR